MHQTLLPDRTPLGLLREAVEASREIDRARAASEAVKRELDAANALVDAAIERRGPLLDEIVRRMKAVGATIVPFYVGAEYWAATREEDELNLVPCHMPPALATTCEAGGEVRFDGAHACTDDEPRIDPIPSPARFNPSMSPIGDADALFAAFMDRIQSGGIDVPDDDDIAEAAARAAFHDLFAPPSARHVVPDIELLARGFAVPDDDEDEGLDDALDDLDLDDETPVPEPDDTEKTREYPALDEAARDVA